MKATVQTFSVVCGTRECNAHCPFCVSRMTGNQPEVHDFNVHNFRIAAEFARQCHANTMLITGCGEPMLYPMDISLLLAMTNDLKGGRAFPFRELQTNGILLRDHIETLSQWHQMGLTTIALSVVDFNTEPNKKIYGKDYPDLEANIALIKDLGFMVRLSVIGVKGMIDSPRAIDDLTDWCHANKVDQITYRRVTRPDHSENAGAAKWVDDHYINDDHWKALEQHVASQGTLLLHLMHGAKVYDITGQNFCMTTCLTDSPDPDQIRQLIYFPDGRLRYSWAHKGAVLL